MNPILDAERVWSTRDDREGPPREILIVDDEEDVRWLLATMLREYGFQPVEARNGQEALEQLEVRSPAVILMDVRMPILDGVSALKKIRADHPDIPIVMITAYGDIGSAVEAMKIGAFDYVTKPFDHAHIVRAVFGALERRAAEEARRDAEARFCSLAETASDAIISADSSGTIVFWNRAAQLMFGYTEEEALGKPLTFLMPERYRAPHQAALERVRSTGQQRLKGKTAELHGLRKGGTEFPIEISLPYAAWKKGDETFYSAIIRDATARKGFEQQFYQVQKMEEMGRLTAGVAHDFNNLLTAIIGYSQLVLDRVRDQPNITADIEEIKKAGERASQLTRQLLAFGRKQLLVPQVLDLNQVVGNFEKMLSRIISEDIRIDIVAVPSLGRTKADPGQIEQLLMNLVVNARDAMPQGGTLTIETANAVLDSAFVRRHVGSEPGHHVSLVVKDTGCGMAPEVLAHVFEPFFTTKGPGKGTGLGLSTVYGLVKQSGGYIMVESSPGVGTTVTMYLPTVDDPVESAAAGPRSVLTIEGTETILLVEDDIGVRNLMRKVFERYGYTVLSAQDVDEAIAIEKGHRGPIHLLVSDMIMPGLNGPELAQRLVRRRPAIKVLFVSGHGSREAIDPGVSSQNASFLQKPFRPETLARKVRERLDGHVGPPGRESTSV